MLPDRLVPLEQLLATPDVVDQDIEPAAFRADPRHQRFDLERHQVIHPDSDTITTSGSNKLSCLFDCFASAILRAMTSARAASHVDGGSGRAELYRDPSPGTARPTGDKSDLFPEVIS